MSRYRDGGGRISSVPLLMSPVNRTRCRVRIMCSLGRFGRSRVRSRCRLSRQQDALCASRARQSTSGVAPGATQRAEDVGGDRAGSGLACRVSCWRDD